MINSTDYSSVGLTALQTLHKYRHSFCIYKVQLWQWQSSKNKNSVWIHIQCTWYVAAPGFLHHGQYKCQMKHKHYYLLLDHNSLQAVQINLAIGSIASTHHPHGGKCSHLLRALISHCWVAGLLVVWSTSRWWRVPRSDKSSPKVSASQTTSWSV